MLSVQEVEVLRAACCVAGIDSDICPAQMQHLEVLAQKCGVGGVSLQHMIARAKSDPQFYKDQFKFIKDSPNECMAILVQVAIADGDLADEEKVVLRGLAKSLNVADPVVEQVLLQAEQIAKNQK